MARRSADRLSLWDSIDWQIPKHAACGSGLVRFSVLINWKRSLLVRVWNVGEMIWIRLLNSVVGKERFRRERKGDGNLFLRMDCVLIFIRVTGWKHTPAYRCVQRSQGGGAGASGCGIGQAREKQGEEFSCAVGKILGPQKLF